MINMRLLFFPLLFIVLLLPLQRAHGTEYYVSFSTASSTRCLGTNPGTSVNGQWCSLRSFTENARTAGDIVFVQRGFATTSNITAMAITSEGTLNSPITVTADYDNIWGLFATTSETYTPVFASTYIPTSASTTLVGVTQWIYLAGDCFEVPTRTDMNACEYAYEVKTASTTGIQLYLPYKGKQSTAVVARVMGGPPIVGSITEAAQIMADGGNSNWIFKGMDWRSTNVGCPLNLAFGVNRILYDMIWQANGAADCGVNASDPSTLIVKNRFFNMVSTFLQTIGITIRDSFFDCNSVASSNFMGGSFNGSAIVRVSGSEVSNCTNLISYANGYSQFWYFDGIAQGGGIASLSGLTSDTRIYVSDTDNTVGKNYQVSNQIGSNTTGTTTRSSIVTVRPGGGPSSMQVWPASGTGNTGLSTRNFPYSYYKLLEYPYYTDTSSKTYTVYFNSTSTAAWANDPTTGFATGTSTPELFIECEYYGSANSVARTVKRSSTENAIDFNGSTAWQSLSVTCQPSQAGILYLRAWYGKTKETPMNEFFMDLSPVVS